MRELKTNNLDLPDVYNEGNILYFNNIKEKTLVDIFDIKGNKCLNKVIANEDHEEITIPGVYVVKLQTNKDVFTYKIIVND